MRHDVRAELTKHGIRVFTAEGRNTYTFSRRTQAAGNSTVARINVPKVTATVGCGLWSPRLMFTVRAGAGDRAQRD